MKNTHLTTPAKKRIFSNLFQKAGNRPNQAGFIAIVVIIITALLLLLCYYFLDFITTDIKITKSHRLATQTYYLAEAGINEAIWRLIHDTSWYNSFTTNPDWQITINRSGVFEPNDSYQVVVQNIEIAKADITATAYLDLPNQTSRRVVKTTVYQSLNFALEGISVYTYRDLIMQGANLTVNDSNIYSYEDVSLNFFSTLNVAGDVQALGNISVSWTSDLNAENLYSQNYPPPPEAITMPPVDFDSASPNSYLSRADQVYSQQQFSNLLNNSTVILNGITYVQGNVNVPRGVDITINGVLVVDGNFNIGSNGMPFWKPNPNLHIYNQVGQPAGLLSKKSITFGAFMDDVDINGLIYAGNILRINSLFTPLTINGGAIAYDFDISSFWQSFVINYDPNVIIITLGNPDTSPVIVIEHWEEEY